MYGVLRNILLVRKELKEDRLGVAVVRQSQ